MKCRKPEKTGSAGPARASWRTGPLAVDVLHLYVLAGFAVTQPLFDLISRNPEFLVAHRAGAASTVFLAGILTFGLPTALAAVEGIFLLFGGRCRTGLHLVWIALLAGLSLSPLLIRSLPLPGYAQIAGAIAAAAAFTLLYARMKPVQWFVSSLIPVMIIFPGLFFLNPTVLGILFPEKKTKGDYEKVHATAPIVFIIFDEFPLISLMDSDLHIDALRFPNFARFAERSFWFRNAITVRAGTEKAVPAILTGITPGAKTVPTLQDHPNNLFTLMGGTYEMKVFETHSSLCPDRLCSRKLAPLSPFEGTRRMVWDLVAVYLHVVLPPEFRHGLPVVSQSWKGFWENDHTAFLPDERHKESGTHPGDPKENRLRLYAAFLDSITDADSTLYFLHILLPHLPWEYLPSGKLYVTDRITIPGLDYKMGGWSGEASLAAQGYQRHLLQVALVDRLLGELVQRLKEKGIFERSLIVVTADHGANFWPDRKRRDVLPDFPMDVRNIPLFMKVPHQKEGKVIDCYVRNIDILPSIAELLGIPLSWRVGGRVLFSRNPSTGEMEPLPCHEVLPPLHAAKRLESLKYKNALFGGKGSQEDLFRPGPYRDIVGREVREFQPVYRKGIHVQLDKEAYFEHVDLESSFIPALISGRLHNADSENPYVLAVAVNDRIAGITRTVKNDSGNWEFSVVVPEAVFVQGKNKIEVFLVQGGEKNVRLVSIEENRMLGYRLMAGTPPEGEHILSPDGRTIKINPELFQSHLETVTTEKAGVCFSGWAADVRRSTLPESILLFKDGVACQSGRTNKYRPDVVRHFQKPELMYSGFQMAVPFSTLPGKTDRNPVIRAFALSADGQATELNYGYEYPFKKSFLMNPPKTVMNAGGGQ